MRPVKSFQEFRSELNETKNLNEGILDAIKKGIKKIGEFFTGVGSSFMNMLVRQKNGDLPKGITVYPTKLDIELGKANGVDIKVPKINESVEENLSEAKVELKHPNKNVRDVGTENLKELIRDTVEAGKKGTPLLIWGAPGIGKTQIINAIAQEYFGPNARDERRIIDYDLMTMMPEDFFLPGEAKDKEGKPTGKSARMPEETLPVYKIGDKDGDKLVNGPDGKGGILFFDELARADERIQNVCLKLIDERKVGNYLLGSNWVIVSAANREQDDETGTFRFSSTLGNRFKQFNFSPTFEEWEKWAGGKNAEGELNFTPEVLAFLRFNHTDYWYDLDTTQGGTVNTIFASPRSWTKASDEIKNRINRRKAQGKEITPEEIEEIAAGTIGNKAASALSGFILLMQKVNPADIKYVYSDADKAPILKDLKVDERNAFFAAVIFNAKDRKLSDKELDNYTKWLIKLNDQSWAMKGASMIKEVHPELGKADSYWVETCIEKLMDHYGPGIFGGR
jgi:MoxR-like ATPase